MNKERYDATCNKIDQLIREHTYRGSYIYENSYEILRDAFMKIGASHIQFFWFDDDKFDTGFGIMIKAWDNDITSTYMFSQWGIDEFHMHEGHFNSLLKAMSVIKEAYDKDKQ